ncbi:MAG: class IV adenylate cyclase [Patescibacteria group bacterium]|nr:class IV adenylate cyclase [Patescibacteria group bacterium]
MKDIEVELKYRVKNKKGLLSWLNKHAKKAYEYHQIDEYFTRPDKNFFDKKIPDEYLRIRRSGMSYSIAYKLWYSTEEGEGTHCDEYETDVKDGKQLEKIFKALEFKTLVIVDKKRAAYDYRNFEIAVDDVREVGVVCEIEIRGNFKSIDEAQAQIREMAMKLGFEEKDRSEDIKLGYALLIAKKKGLFS